MSIVRTSPVLLSKANEGKLVTLHEFLEEYRKVVQCTIDHAWDNRLIFGERILDIQNDRLDLPPIPAAFFRTGKNTGKGFYWRSTGCFLSPGVEFAVPSSDQ